MRSARQAGAGVGAALEQSLAAARDRRERLREDLVGARARGELAVAWQPIVSLTEQRVTGVEALARWVHPSSASWSPRSSSRSPSAPAWSGTCSAGCCTRP